MADTRNAQETMLDGIQDISKLNDTLDQRKNELFSTYTENAFLNTLRQLYFDLTVNLGKDWHPYINGRYMIFMQHGPWFLEDLPNVSKDQKIFSQNSLNTFQTDKKFSNFPRLATDIDLPQINNEYLTLSTRNQGITYFHRQTMLPDFSISYIENHIGLDIIQYHDLWFKMMELYRRGEIDTSKRKSKNCNYFYEVPYLNAIWVIIFDITFQIRGLIYLVGIKPVNHPLKEFLGNRSNSKITVYNIQYKTTNMYYQFFNDSADFLNHYNKTADNELMSKFKEFANNFSGNNSKDAATAASTVPDNRIDTNTIYGVPYSTYA